MNRLILLIAAGTPVFKLADGVRGSLASDAAVDFGEVSPDVVAQAWANDNTLDREQRLAFLDLLSHIDEETGRPVKYTPQGNRVLISEDREGYFKVRAAVERAVEKAHDLFFASETDEDKFSDSVAEEVARTSDAITSPAEQAEKEAAEAPTQPAQPGEPVEEVANPANPSTGSEFPDPTSDNPPSGRPVDSSEATTAPLSETIGSGIGDPEKPPVTGDPATS